MNHTPRSVLVAVAFLAFVAPASAQWVQQSPRPTGLDLYDVAFPSLAHGFVVGQNSIWDEGAGALYQTADAGNSWIWLDVPEISEPLDALFFLDAQRGWAMGNGISDGCCHYRTLDGGATWLSIEGPIGSTYSVRFLTPSFGYALGNYGFSISRDGGVSWSTAPSDIHFVDFRNTSLGLGVSTSDGILRTADGGLSFTLVRGGGASAARFLTDDVAVASAGDRLLRSIDGGLTWTDRGPAQGTTSLLALTELDAVAFRYDGRVLRTSNAGLTWSDLGIALPDGMVDWTIVSPGVAVFVSGGGDVWRTDDGGATFTKTLEGIGDLPASWGVTFLDELHGWIAGVHGLIFESADGGVTWTQLSQGVGQDFRDVGTFTDTRRIAVAKNGYVARTSDSGRTWRAQKLEVTGQIFGRDETLEAVSVVDADFAVAAGFGGVVFKTADGGETWTSIGYPALRGDFYIRDVHFTSRTTGWVVGRDETFGQGRDDTVWRTTDGGATWTQPLVSAFDFFAVDFEGSSGWIMSYSGAVYRTTNGSATWTFGTLPMHPGGFSATVLDLEFAPGALVGYAAGWDGYVAKSTNGGVTWTTLDLGTTEHVLTDLFTVSPTEVWAATADGLAYHTLDGGATWTTEVVNLAPGAFASLEGIAVTPSGAVWSAGYEGDIYARPGTSPYPKVRQAGPPRPR